MWRRSQWWQGTADPVADGPLTVLQIFRSLVDDPGADCGPAPPDSCASNDRSLIAEELARAGRRISLVDRLYLGSGLTAAMIAFLAGMEAMAFLL